MRRLPRAGKRSECRCEWKRHEKQEPLWGSQSMGGTRLRLMRRHAATLLARGPLGRTWAPTWLTSSLFRMMKEPPMTDPTASGTGGSGMLGPVMGPCASACCLSFARRRCSRRRWLLVLVVEDVSEHTDWLSAAAPSLQAERPAADGLAACSERSIASSHLIGSAAAADTSAACAEGAEAPLACCPVAPSFVEGTAKPAAWCFAATAVCCLSLEDVLHPIESSSNASSAPSIRAAESLGKRPRSPPCSLRSSLRSWTSNLSHFASSTSPPPIILCRSGRRARRSSPRRSPRPSRRWWTG